jgi:hypothetical protein
VRTGPVPGAGEAGTHEVVRIAGHLFMDDAAGAAALAEHNAVGVPPSAVKDHDVARHEAKDSRPRDGRARIRR